MPLGRSPRATFAVNKARFSAGDDVQFQVDLNADDVLFPLRGYNVQAVRIYRKTAADDGSPVLVLANQQQASIGQTQFTIPWLATVDSVSGISFVAFFQTKLLGELRWQAGLVSLQGEGPVTGRTVSIWTTPSRGTSDLGGGLKSSRALGDGEFVDAVVASDGAGMGRSSSTADAVSATTGGTFSGAVACVRSDAGLSASYRARVFIAPLAAVTLIYSGSLTPSGNMLHGIAGIGLVDQTDNNSLAVPGAAGIDISSRGDGRLLLFAGLPPTSVRLQAGRRYELQMVMGTSFCTLGSLHAGGIGGQVSFRFEP